MLIKLRDYDRIHRIIRTVVMNEGADPSASCLYFGVIGSLILSKHFGIHASPRCGVAAFRFDPEKMGLLYGRERKGEIISARDGFHCWIEAEDWIIDFSIPSLSYADLRGTKFPPKMFQVKLDQMANCISEVQGSTGFFLECCPRITSDLVDDWFESALNLELARVCLTWYKKVPSKIPDSVFIYSASGCGNVARLSGPTVKSKW